ncbi:MAG: hypothetical protein K6E30_02875, partial [Lachnospiraceae bacterium]|nr:hypothetical protein [Lachnospiraceae bacterium]
MRPVKKKRRRSGYAASGKVNQQREELLLSLEDEPLREISKSAGKEMREHVQGQLIRYFTTAEISAREYYGRGSVRILKVRNLKDLENYLSVILVRAGHLRKEYAVELVCGDKKPTSFFLDEVSRAYPEFAARYEPVWKKASGRLLAFTNPMDCIEELSAWFTRGRILDMLTDNPHMELLLRERGQVRKEMLDRVPARYVDLYPETRRMRRHFILHIGPTNSGKTYEAIKALENAGSGVYLGPLRLLAYEQYERINGDGLLCSLLTGEERIPVAGSSITASTIEMADLDRFYMAAVIDEAQMVADSERGGAWTAAILGLLAAEIHICASQNAEQIL